MDDPLLWQKRVIVERDELKEKLTKLTDFFASKPELDPEDHRLLSSQHSAMSVYLDVLDRRIARF